MGQKDISLSEAEQLDLEWNGSEYAATLTDSNGVTMFSVTTPLFVKFKISIYFWRLVWYYCLDGKLNRKRIFFRRCVNVIHMGNSLCPLFNP